MLSIPECTESGVTAVAWKKFLTLIVYVTLAGLRLSTNGITIGDVAGANDHFLPCIIIYPGVRDCQPIDGDL